jgi:hypothetical protein
MHGRLCVLYTDYLDQLNNKKAERTRQKLNWLTWSIRLAAQELMTRHPAIREKMEAGKDKIQLEPSTAFNLEFEIENLMNELLHSSDFTAKDK